VTGPRLDAVVAGYTGVDLAPGFAPEAEPVPLTQLLRPGTLTEVGPLQITPGGVVPNTGLAMNAFGCRVALQGLIGEDGLGDLLLGLLEEHGAEVRLRRTKTAGTAYGIVIAPPGSDRVFLECPGANATFGAEDVDYDLVARSRLLHFGYPPLMPRLCADEGAELATLLSRARGLGVTTSLDMTLPDPEGATGNVDWRRLLTRVLPQVDVFAPSVEELLVMLAPGEAEHLVAQAAGGDIVDIVPESLCRELAEEALALGAAIVFLKVGSRGGYCHSRCATPLSSAGDASADGGVWLPPLPVDPARFVNACGAGDAAAAGFLTGLLRGDSIALSGHLAMRAGRDSLYGVDTTSGLTSWKEMKAEAG
jgi:sugar/nucleoside kinase (ribokinase family)